MSAPRHLLFLSSHHGVGASETLWIDTAAKIAAAGVKVTALVAWRKRDAARLAPLTDRGVTCSQINPLANSGVTAKLLRRMLPSGAWQMNMFRRALKRINPTDLIISQGNDVSALPYLEVALEFGVPFQVVTHGVNDAEWPRDDEADRLRRVFTAARLTHWVARSNVEDFEYHIGAKLERASVVRNPVKVPRDLPFEWPTSGEPLRLACVARMQTRPKGHDLLLRALADPKWKDRPLRLSFFGDGENRRGIERLASMLGISEQIEFRGHVSDVAAIWKEHHMIAQPSRNEGMPLSLVEALMCGRPALATDVAGHAELVEDGVNGFIAEAATPLHIGAALERAWEQRANWADLGREAYARIRRDVPEDPAAQFAERILSSAA